jgi:signal transduction histidine kinase/CheY-like chemotaxis protein
MKRIADYSLKWKLLLVPLVATACFSAYLVYSSLVMSNGNSIVRKFRDTDFPILDAAEKNLSGNDRLLDALNAAVATGEKEYLKSAQQKANEILKRYDELEQLDTEHKNEIEKLKSGFKDYFALSYEAARVMTIEKNQPAAQLIREMREKRDAYITRAVAYKAFAEKDFHDVVNNEIATAEQAQGWGLAIGTGMLGFIAVLTLLVTRGILALEKSVAERNKMLARVNGELEQEIEKLKIAEDAKIHAEATSQIKDEFLANMSHEIRTPMNAIIGLTQLTLEADLPLKQRNHLRMVHTSSKSLLRILDDILDYSKIEAGKLALEQVEFHLEDVVKSVSDLFSAKIAEKGLGLFVEIDKDINFNLKGDSLRLGQVLNNLVGNAIKFTEHGEINLKIGLVSNDENNIRLRFAVRDTGIGMDNVQSHRLFKAFSQADTSITRKYGGTGLGLTISKQLVEMMGGEIVLTSMPGKGSTFTFTAIFERGEDNLNLYHQHGMHEGHVLIVDDQKAKIKDRRVDLLVLAGPIRGARILLVEDNDINQEVASEFLNKSGLVVTLANHGGEAVEWVQKETFDAVLMDLQMPVMDGFMATELIRKLPQGKDLPIIALSASAMIQDKQASEQAGMNGHISKPLDPVQLVTILLKWVAHRRIETVQNAGIAPTASGLLPNELPGFDLNAALVRLYGNENLLSKLLLRFATEYSPVHSEVMALLRDNQGDKAAALLHKTKGAASSLGAIALAEIAQQLETEIKSGKTPYSQNAFAKHLDEAIQAIRDNIHAGNILGNLSQSPPDATLVESWFVTLDTSLKNHEMPEDDQLTQLLTGITGTVSYRLVAELERHLQNFEFKSARATLIKVIEEWHKNSNIL